MQQQARRAAAHDEPGAGFGELGITLEREIGAAFALGDGRQVEERFRRRRLRADQTTEAAAGLGHVAHLVGELAEAQVGLVADRRIVAQALELLARFIEAIEPQQRVRVGEALGVRIERRGFLRDGDGGHRVAFGGEHARELRARRARGRLVGEHAVREFVRGGEVEGFEREIGARGEHRSDTSGDSSVGRSVFSAMAVPPGIADLTDEFDQRLVTAERVGAQDGRARFLGLIETHRGQRHRGGRAGAVGLELLPAPGGLGAGADLLALRRDLVGALGNLGIVRAERRFEIALGAAAAVTARQRHVGEHEIGIVGIGGGQRTGAESATTRRVVRRKWPVK